MSSTQENSVLAFVCCTIWKTIADAVLAVEWVQRQNAQVHFPPPPKSIHKCIHFSENKNPQLFGEISDIGLDATFC